MKAVIAVVLFAVAAFAYDSSLPAINHDLISAINNDPSSTWKAGVNVKFLNRTLAYAAHLCGVLPEAEYVLKTNVDELEAFPQEVIDALPTDFDARKEWGTTCPSVGEVRDQANCGSCWAFGAVEAITDRTCILSQGKNSPHISAQDMNSCCTTCGMGCNGGYPAMAWQYWVSSGVVTGGNYKGGLCYPYSLPNCDHHTDGKYGPCPATVPTPRCTKQCENGAVWANDKKFGARTYSVSGADNIAAEIQKNGPVEAAFSVYEDFLTYKKGVYQHKTGSMLGGHAVKIIGWGEENGVKYWTIANSWNEDWGDQGYFKILRGSNHCGIEGQIVAGIPK
jgi:cathepsin B